MAELVMHTTVYWTVPDGIEPKDYIAQLRDLSRLDMLCRADDINTDEPFIIEED
jgi:hypothetical protein